MPEVIPDTLPLPADVCAKNYGDLHKLFNDYTRVDVPSGGVVNWEDIQGIPPAFPPDVNVTDARYIRYDAVQSLLEDQRHRARTNLDVFGKSEAEDWGFIPSASAPTLPEAPTNFTANVSGGVVDLSWSHSGENITGFEIRREPVTPLPVVATLGVNVRSYQDTPQAGGLYDYYVRAVNAAGNAEVGPIRVDLSIGTAPNAPSNFQYDSNEDGTLDISWEHDGVNVDKFIVTYQLVGGFIATNEFDSSVRSWHMGLSFGFYKIKVAAANTFGTASTGFYDVNHDGFSSLP